MTDTLGTIWDAEPHTLVKHAILRRYLQAWFPILTSQAKLLQKQYGSLRSREILFVDGFAGPGEYTGGEPGSPVIALRAALDHGRSFPMPVQLLFVENNEKRFRHLESVLQPDLERATKSPNIRGASPRLGECDTVLSELLNQCDRTQTTFGPALAFFDQFGYGGVSMDLIRRVLSFPQCEVFTYLNYKDMNRWISDPHKADAFTRAFGGEEWRECIALPEQQRRSSLLDMYKTALRQRAQSKYLVSFMMFDKNDVPLYWLLFCTNNLRGLEEMKRSMWAVDKTGEFRFSDRDNPEQLGLLERCFDQGWLAEEMGLRLAGRTMTVLAIKEFVLAETPCHLFKAALKALESTKAAVAVNQPIGRKPGTFPEAMLEGISLRFADRRSLF